MKTNRRKFFGLFGLVTLAAVFKHRMQPQQVQPLPYPVSYHPIGQGVTEPGDAKAIASFLLSIPDERDRRSYVAELRKNNHPLYLEVGHELYRTLS